MTTILTSGSSDCQNRTMKTKDIQKGVAYSKRGWSSQWGVVVTTEKLFSFPKYSPDTSLYSGSGILVLVPRAPIGKGTYGTTEAAIAVAKKLETPSVGSIRPLLDKIAKKGLGLEIWLPREFAATVEDAEVARQAEREYDRQLQNERRATEVSLKEQFARIKNDLGVEPHAYFNIKDNEITMSPSEWKKMMDRVEALIQTAGPLSTGSL